MKEVSIVSEDQKKAQVEIFVNTRPKSVPHGIIKYEEILSLAFPGENIPDIANFTITYTLPKGNKDGIVVYGSHVAVHEGMAFNVKRTDKS